MTQMQQVQDRQSIDSHPTSVSPMALVMRSRSFLIAAIVLLVAAAGLNISVGRLKLHFRKEPVPLRQSLSAVPEQLGTWVQLSKDVALKDEIQDALGTREYIFRHYVNAVAMTRDPKSLLEEYRRKSVKESEEELSRVKPNSFVETGVTYYTGGADTVAHIPERCYLADGYNEETSTSEDWGARGEFPVRFITFKKPSETRRDAPIKHVAYLFQVNGQYTSSSMEVRRQLQSLRVRHAYYAKIELMSMVRDRDEARKAMRGFLESSMPEIEKCLPKWADYQTR